MSCRHGSDTSGRGSGFNKVLATRRFFLDELTRAETLVCSGTWESDLLVIADIVGELADAEGREGAGWCLEKNLWYV